MSNNTFKVTLVHEFSEKRVKDLLVGALEGGSNYWYSNARMDLADGYTKADFKTGGRMQDPNDYYHWAELVPFVPGCALVLDVEDSPNEGQTEFRLTRNKIERGLDIMAQKYPKHFQNWVQENDDAITSDVFLQCCLFGEAVFG